VDGGVGLDGVGSATGGVRFVGATLMEAFH
jgi:hypothetical protein